MVEGDEEEEEEEEVNNEESGWSAGIWGSEKDGEGVVAGGVEGLEGETVVGGGEAAEEGATAAAAAVAESTTNEVGEADDVGGEAADGACHRGIFFSPYVSKKESQRETV